MSDESPGDRATNTGGHPYLDRAYALGGPDDARALYDEWAERYDADLADPTQGYVGPQRAAVAVEQIVGVADLADAAILDAGCGTGLVGVELAALGARTIDGVDVSPGMLARAQATGVYRHLQVADLTRPVPQEADAYDAVVCVGTLTHGHVGPGALGEFTRLVRPGGHVVATVLDDLWESGGFHAEAERLEQMGLVDLVSAELADYRAGAGVAARTLVLRVQ